MWNIPITIAVTSGDMRCHLPASVLDIGLSPAVLLNTRPGCGWSPPPQSHGLRYSLARITNPQTVKMTPTANGTPKNSESTYSWPYCLVPKIANQIFFPDQLVMRVAYMAPINKILDVRIRPPSITMPPIMAFFTHPSPLMELGFDSWFFY